MAAVGFAWEVKEWGRQVECPEEAELEVVLLVSKCLMGLPVGRERWMG